MVCDSNTCFQQRFILTSCTDHPCRDRGAKSVGDAADGFVSPHVVRYANYSRPMWCSVHSALSCINARGPKADDCNSIVKPIQFEGRDDLEIFFLMETGNEGLMLYSPQPEGATWFPACLDVQCHLVVRKYRAYQTQQNGCALEVYLSSSGAFQKKDNIVHQWGVVRQLSSSSPCIPRPAASLNWRLPCTVFIALSNQERQALPINAIADFSIRKDFKFKRRLGKISSPN